VRRSCLPIALIVALAMPAAGWTRPASSHAPGDPWERANRRTFAFNLALDRALIRPLSRLTAGLTPDPISRLIHNFLVNLNEPVVIVNDLLQARPGPAVRSAFRLAINSTVGGLGAVDVAKALGDPRHVNGFGDTLGRWRVGPGPYLIVPVFGPSTVRDLFGSLVDDATLPLQFLDYPYRTEVDITVNIVGGLNQREDVAKDYDTLLEGAADPYATLRSSYLQSREAQIRGDKALPPLPDIEDVPAAPEAAPAPAPPPTPATSANADPKAPLTDGPGGPGLAAGEPHALQALPGQQGGDADDEIARSLEEGDGQ
jgi:phospholipid-binding lipoprotein MlaA